MLPLVPVIDFHFTDQLRILVRDGNRQPLPALSGLDLVAVLLFILLELDVVQKNKKISPVNLIEISEPGQILRLVNGYDHFHFLITSGGNMSSNITCFYFSCSNLTNMGLETTIPAPRMSIR